MDEKKKELTAYYFYIINLDKALSLQLKEYTKDQITNKFFDV